jgi:hypothetical protein
MPRQIREIRTPRNVVSELPKPVTSRIEVPIPVVRGSQSSVVRGISPPVVSIPDTTIGYPTIDVPTEEQFQGDMSPQQPQTPTPTPDTRDLPTTPSPAIPTQPSIEVGGVDIPLPDPGPLVAAGSLAVVTTVVTLGATIAVSQAKTALEPMLKKMVQPKKKKIKIKQVKPVLHYIPNENGTVECIQYSQKGMKVLEGGIEKFEQHLRDQVEIDALWEYDNKIIIDEELSKNLTKEGQKRFKKYFASPKVIAKKLGAKLSF